MTSKHIKDKARDICAARNGSPCRRACADCKADAKMVLAVRDGRKVHPTREEAMRSSATAMRLAGGGR
jgi:hypothetical protein